MRSLLEMDTIQLEITDACMNSCSNCTRFCGHKKPYFMTFDQFKEAVDSMIDYPKMTGIMGGEPLLHPEFEKFCEYLLVKIPRKQLGLWTSLPKGFEHYKEVICKTFYNIFINDHTRSDIYHHPGLVAIEEVVADKNKMWDYIWKCWAQQSWSASINPKGAYFCEIAAALSILFDGSPGWKIEPGWWWRMPWKYKEQIEEFCPKCGFSIPLKRRASTENIDDISPKNFDRLKTTSPKINQGRFKMHDLKLEDDFRPMAMYKDFNYRNDIAHRFGMFLTINSQGFWEPHLYKGPIEEFTERKSLMDIYKERYK